MQSPQKMPLNWEIRNTYVLRREGDEPGDSSHAFLLDLREHLKAGDQHGVHVGYGATYRTQ